MVESEYIVFAAMKEAGTDKEVCLENENYRVGLSHGDIINANMYAPLKVGYARNDYGFMTNIGRFVSREEAAVIARNAGQLYEQCKETQTLNSYELDLITAGKRLMEENIKLYFQLKDCGFGL